MREGLGFLRTALLVFAFVALFVGAFVIFNTFNIVVTQRTREMGLLQALGASRGQVFTSVIIESLVIGLLGSALGLAAGIGLAVLLKQGLELIGLELPPTPLAIRPTTIIAALVLGTVVTVIASVFPARRASRVAPIEALREGPWLPPRPSAAERSWEDCSRRPASRARACSGTSRSPPRSSGSSPVTFIGVAVLSPFVARPLATAIGLPPATRDDRPPRARERQAQPPPDGVHGRGADDRPRSRRVRLRLHDDAEGVGVRHAR